MCVAENHLSILEILRMKRTHENGADIVASGYGEPRVEVLRHECYMKIINHSPAVKFQKFVMEEKVPVKCISK